MVLSWKTLCCCHIVTDGETLGQCTSHLEGTLGPNLSMQANRNTERQRSFSKTVAVPQWLQGAFLGGEDRELQGGNGNINNHSALFQAKGLCKS